MTLVTIEFKTEMTTRLDPDELKEDVEIGHGSFGIVYKGEFFIFHIEKVVSSNSF